MSRLSFLVLSKVYDLSALRYLTLPYDYVDLNNTPSPITSASPSIDWPALNRRIDLGCRHVALPDWSVQAPKLFLERHLP